MRGYQYTECGLNNVLVEGIGMVEDRSGDMVMTIQAIGELHREIARHVVTQTCKMTGRELRFLRTEMGVTQAGLASLLKVTPLTVGRWEREESPITDAAEMLVRLLADTRLELGIDLAVDDVSAMVARPHRTRTIRIDGSDPPRYKRFAA